MRLERQGPHANRWPPPCHCQKHDEGCATKISDERRESLPYNLFNRLTEKEQFNRREHREHKEKQALRRIDAITFR